MCLAYFFLVTLPLRDKRFEIIANLNNRLINHQTNKSFTSMQHCSKSFNYISPNYNLFIKLPPRFVLIFHNSFICQFNWIIPTLDCIVIINRLLDDRWQNSAKRPPTILWKRRFNFLTTATNILNLNSMHSHIVQYWSRYHRSIPSPTTSCTQSKTTDNKKYFTMNVSLLWVFPGSWEIRQEQTAALTE